MILNYVLCTSLLIVSATQMADLFLKADKTLNQTKKDFIEKTRETHIRGSLSLMGAIFTVMFSALLLFFVTKFKIELTEARYRKTSYLCMNELNIKTENYIFDMTAFNWLLRTAYAATMTANPTSLAAFKALTIARNARHGHYLSELLKTKFCTVEMAQGYLRNLPYKTKKMVILETNIDQTTFVREKQWTIKLFKLPSGIRLKNAFSLHTTFHLQGSFEPNLKVETEEKTNRVFSKLKWRSGSHSFF